VSLYTDDLVVFVALVEHDIRVVRAILDIFMGTSGHYGTLVLVPAHPFLVQVSGCSSVDLQVEQG
jgi:hypothetical protein